MSDGPLPAAATSAVGPMSGLLRRVVAVLSSYALAIVLLLLLLVLTFFGTLEQAHMSLLDVQVKYFESWFVVHDIGFLSIPLPGATPVLVLLALNLVVGGVVRMRKRWTTAGVLVAHLGILLLLGGSYVEWLLSDKGQMTLYEGQASDEFASYHDWEIVVRERKDGGAATEFVLPSRRLMALDEDDTVRFASARLPFDVVVSRWRRNTEPARGSGADAVDGWRLETRKAEKEAERNLPGALVALAGKDGGTARARTLLWGLQGLPWVHEEDGRRFEVELRKVRWALPFRVTLDRFVKEDHPGIGMARRFSSFVTRTEGGVDAAAHITMNAPLRHHGYTFYQSGWGPEGAAPGTRLFSTFSVVRNPSDQVPKYACGVIFLGLLAHFLTKFVLHLVKEARRRAAAGSAA
ncbi:MAG: cytochrome c biogenesis protein ResB [Planctomycetota bacterium]